ncbi:MULTISPECIES: phytoene desaturase family protein [Paenibacillus]|nr:MULTISPECIES: FAD-dependent oxidoreductase [Paenibacillus]
MKMYDAAVIGGGLAGLIAAIDLARAKKSVILLEKSSRVGGRAVSTRKNGAIFNLGGHALYPGGEAYQILQELGVKLEGGSPPAKGLALWRGRLTTLPGDPASLLASKLLSWPGKIELGRFMLKLGKLETHALPNIALRDWAEREIRDPMVRHLFYALCRTSTYVQDPDRQSVGPVLRQVQRSLKSGVLYLNGGWQRVVDQLHDLAVRAGVTVLNNKNVTGLLQENGVVRGLQCTDGELVCTPNVIATGSPADTYRLLGEAAERTALRRWKNDARPASAACLDLGLNRLPVADRHFAIGLDQPIFFSHHSRVAKLSHNGTLVMHLIKYIGSGDSHPQADERALEQTMDLLHPGWQQEVVARQYLPNITVVHDYMHIGRQDSQPGPAVSEVRGLYVAGDWASHGEMLADAAAASARRAALRLLKDLAATANHAITI